MAEKPPSFMDVDQDHIAVVVSGPMEGWVFVRHADGVNWVSAAKLTPMTFRMLQSHVAKDRGQLIGDAGRRG